MLIWLMLELDVRTALWVAGDAVRISHSDFVSATLREHIRIQSLNDAKYFQIGEERIRRNQ